MDPSGTPATNSQGIERIYLTKGINLVESTILSWMPCELGYIRLIWTGQLGPRRRLN